MHSPDNLKSLMFLTVLLLTVMAKLQAWVSDGLHLNTNSTTYILYILTLGIPIIFFTPTEKKDHSIPHDYRQN